MSRHLGIFVILIALMTAATCASYSNANRLPLHGRRVALDPGHFETANDTGAVNTVTNGTLIERDVNWEVVQATKVRLEALGAKVLILRHEGEYIGRSTRHGLANAFGAEVLVSVHHNGSTDHTINYSATFYTQPDDKPIAELAYQKLSAALGTTGGDVWNDTFTMTAKPKMPSVLTEAWFITNDHTAERYLEESGARTSDVPGEGWQTRTLVSLESQALSDAVLEFLMSNVDGRMVRN